jgi:hypothetical protein
VREQARVIARRERRRPRVGEDPQVDTAGFGISPAQLAGRHHQRALFAQDLPQMMQLAAEVRERLRVGRLGPERPRYPLARLWCPRMDSQECDESNRARRTRLNAGPVLGDALFPQEGDVQHGNEASSGSP